MKRAAWSVLSATALLAGAWTLPVLAVEIAPTNAPGKAELSHSAKDLYYKQTLGLKYQIELIRDKQTYIVDNRFPFRSGDEIRFRVKPNVNGYMYIVLKQGSTGGSAVLFPDASLSDNNGVGQGYEYVIPSNGTLQFDNNPGLETVNLVLAKQPFDPQSVVNKERSIKISAKPGETAIGNHCYLDTPAALSTGHCTDKEQAVTMVTTDMTAPLTAELVLKHDSEGGGAVTTADLPSIDNRQATTAVQISTAGPSNPDVASGDSSRVQDKWAFVIGISKFQRPGINLLFAAKDAKDFGSFLVSEEHFAPDHVRVLTDDEATRSHILSEVGDRPGWLPRNIKPGDLVVLYIATHATSAHDDTLGDKNFLVAYDTDPARPFATGIELQNLVDTLKERLSKVTNRIMLVLDTCHAGAAGAKQVFVHPKVDVQAIFQGSGQMVLASCQPQQVSFDSIKFQNGLFTKYLIDGLRQNADVQSSFKRITASVAGESKNEFQREQTPMLKDDDWKGGPLILSAPPAQPRPVR